jgi:hypothetical protein
MKNKKQIKKKLKYLDKIVITLISKNSEVKASPLDLYKIAEEYWQARQYYKKKVLGAQKL